ncbi:hypothetical protein [Cronobacter dublinensis]|uniref:hypothetical protein n=1 Tax=Cronobacter dublinensis TaxID=413497 RepID=UPI0024AE9A7C|nr:hypothetical protein [Cronobacter dublinensis]MDI7502943.1 hypothetical protein [Cronobacter dublinensis]
MAIVIKSHTQENIGKVVQLACFLGNGMGPYLKRKDMWLIRAVQSKLKTQLFYINPGEECACPAEYLMPIDGGDFSKEDERQKELTNG